MWESEFKRRKRAEEGERKRAATLAKCAQAFAAAGDTVAVLGPVESDNGHTRHHRHLATGHRIAHTTYTTGQHTVRVIDDSGEQWRLVGEGCVLDTFAEAAQAAGLA